jgi:hypothetical protein
MHIVKNCDFGAIFYRDTQGSHAQRPTEKNKQHNMAEDLSPEDLVCRRATFADYKQVMGFTGNVKSGNDYLAAMFYPILHNTNTSAFVVANNGRVVGIRMKMNLHHISIIKDLNITVLSITTFIMVVHL